ncbi:MAG: GTPase ObgE [Planctomycetales bacterium]|nr:GTPase ObgE [Planctomycetales bacterium]
MFVDRVQIDVAAGKGGDGCSSFRRERYVPKGGPDGGDGGDGGSVILVAEDGVDNLSYVAHRKQWRADPGRHGEGSNRHGRNGEDQIIQVPPGTIVIDAREGFILKDLTCAGESVVAAKGGRGGRGNTHFKSSTNRAPRQCTPGEDGETRRLILELKSIADVGLVGLPNAGKSTLLSRLSRARPEIANYPFTTKTPHLGQVQIDFDRSFIMADIPGLIHGAHEGVGLGHDFLRHVERTRVLVHLVEPMPMDESDPVANYKDIRNEVLQYSAELGDRPELIVVTKAELPNAEEVHKRLSDELGRQVFLVSAVTGQNLNVLVQEIVRTLDAVDLSIAE